MDNYPLVSIITSTLNAGEMLRKTIESIHRQNYSSYEHIIVDGGSTDSTLDIIEQSGNRVTTFITGKDSGIYDAWNKGLQLAKGQYVGFLGAGDGYLEEGLSSMVNCAVTNPGAEYLSSKVALMRNGTQIKVAGAAWSWNSFRHYMTTAHPGSLHSRGFFEKYGTFDTNFKIAGDFEILLRAGPNLRTNFVNQVTTMMEWGGISQSDSRCLVETEIAKLKNHSVNRLEARLDRYTAEVKRAIRNVLSR